MSHFGGPQGRFVLPWIGLRLSGGSRKGQKGSKWVTLGVPKVGSPDRLEAISKGWRREVRMGVGMIVARLRRFSAQAHAPMSLKVRLCCLMFLDMFLSFLDAVFEATF